MTLSLYIQTLQETGKLMEHRAAEIEKICGVNKLPRK